MLWGRAGDASAGEWLQIQIIISTINVMHLNHAETFPIPLPKFQSWEKLFSTKPVPGAKKIGDHGPRP